MSIESHEQSIGLFHLCRLIEKFSPGGLRIAGSHCLCPSVGNNAGWAPNGSLLACATGTETALVLAALAVGGSPDLRPPYRDPVGRYLGPRAEF